MKIPSFDERCQGITNAGAQCKCYATQRINDVPYCEQQAAKALAVTDTRRRVEKSRAGERKA